MVHQNISYLGELRCQATHGPSSIQLITDAPTDNLGKGESFSPTDLVVTALATCIITTAGIAARREQVLLDGTKMYAEKHMSTDAPRRIAKIVLRMEVAQGVPKQFREKLQAIANTCPVKKSLHPEVVVSIEFLYPD
jgi:putative redox protein